MKNTNQFYDSNVRYTSTKIKMMPTLHRSQFYDTKFNNGEVRVLLSRLTKEDGEPYNNRVVTEININGNWIQTDEYEALPFDGDELAVTIKWHYADIMFAISRNGRALTTENIKKIVDSITVLKDRSVEEGNIILDDLVMLNLPKKEEVL